MWRDLFVVDHHLNEGDAVGDPGHYVAAIYSVNSCRDQRRCVVRYRELGESWCWVECECWVSESESG